MAGIREETTAVGQHPHETAQQAQLRQLRHLTFHAVFLIVEPPAGTELHLAWHAFALEVADHGAQHFVVAWVQTVQDGFWQQILFVLFAQQF
ncbi:hypothetical protein D3C72_1439850 [compost metagenome]